MANKLTISEVLRGCDVGRMQSVGYMQVIPLISELEDTRFSVPSELEIGTRGYGSMEFSNPTPEIAIVPCHAGVVTKQLAQDHAMSHVGILKARETKTFNTAMCIQQTQGGLISKMKHRLLILPFQVREDALDVRKQSSHGKLWTSLSTLNEKTGIRGGGGHLVRFLEKFEKQLDQFVAEFECVPRQVGAIVLIDGEVVGVERAPSHKYWKDIWPSMIRECYGSIAIQTALDKGEAKPPATRIPLKAKINSLDDLVSALDQVEKDEDEKTKKVVREMISDEFEAEKEEVVAGLTALTLRHKQFVGQVIKDDERIVYGSFVATKKWAKNASWYKATAFKL